MRIPPPTALIGVAVAAALIGGAFVLSRPPEPSAGGAANVPVPDAVARSTAVDAVTLPPTPFDVVDGEGEGAAAGPAVAGTGTTVDPVDPVNDSAATSPADESMLRQGARPDIAAIGLAPWTNAGFDRQVARFGNDPHALALLIDAFRSETDPARLERLAALLGEVGHPDLAGIGAQMVASGDPVSRDAGLALLRTLQPNDAAARETLIGLLATETDPTVLDALIDAVAIPDGTGAGDAGQADALVAQLVPLTEHPSAAVRRNGVAVLSRWSADARVVPILQQALGDSDAGVRASAVYAFAERPDLDASVRQDLLAVLENRQEGRGTRSGAMLALQRTDLDAEQARRLRAVERELASTL